MIIEYGMVRKVGRFYANLNAQGKKEAKAFARNAGRMSRPEIEREYARLQRVARVANFDYNPTK